MQHERRTKTGRFAYLAKKSQGQIAYEQDVQRKPLYHDGTPPRKNWDDLTDVQRYSWERPVAK